MGGSRCITAYVCAELGFGNRNTRCNAPYWILKSAAAPVRRMNCACSSTATFPLGAVRETDSNSAMGTPVSAATSATSMIASCKFFAPVRSSSSGSSASFGASTPHSDEVGGT